MLTEKQKNFILENIDVLDTYSLQEIVESLIDNMTKEYATKLIGEMIEDLKNVDYRRVVNLFWSSRFFFVSLHLIYEEIYLFNYITDGRHGGSFSRTRPSEC
jgi:UDP-galactopyranose mutase